MNPKIVKVYQTAKKGKRQGSLNEFWFDRNPEDLEVPAQPTAHVVVNGDLRLIAQLEEAYRSTNSIEWGWWKNQNVITNHSEDWGCRSTSVGDVIEDADGTRWIVDNTGFILWEKALIDHKLKETQRELDELKEAAGNVEALMKQRLSMI